MGNWSMHIDGHGIHDNSVDGDADALLKKFVADLYNAGHIVHSAVFHAGSGKHLASDLPLTGEEDYKADT